MGLFSRGPQKRLVEPEGPDLPLRKADLEALLEDMAAGAKYQQALFPPASVPLPGYDLAWMCRPARMLSGDFCDLFHFEPFRLGLLVADASGKSIPASLLAVMCHLLFRTRPEPMANPALVLRHVNRQLLGNIKRGTFISAVYGVLDAERHTVTIANAGHLPVVVWHAREKVATSHRPRGSVLGVLPPAAYEREVIEETIALAPGDRFVLLTDGVNEAMAPGQREFGMEHLRKRLKSDSDGGSIHFLRSILQEIEIHRGGGDQSDDITVVTGRRLP